MRVSTYAARAAESLASCRLILIQWAMVETGMDCSENVTADSGLAAPSAVSAAEFVYVASRVYSIALLEVGMPGINDSIVMPTNGPPTIPGLRSGATVVSDPVRVFFT